MLFALYTASEGGTPPDGIPISVVTMYNLALVIVYYVLSALGLAFTTVCLIFNFTQRNKKWVHFIQYLCYLTHQLNHKGWLRQNADATLE